MIRSITKQKPFEEILSLLEHDSKIFIIGCGTCTTMTRTGGKPEVLQMMNQLKESKKEVTGCMMIPVACDELTHEALEEKIDAINGADALLIMTCAFGVQTIAMHLDKQVVPALDTLFIGKEKEVGVFDEVCLQCGECVLGETAGICPVAGCHKGLVNGPCGGTNKGKCEVDSNKDCVWTLIYKKLEKMDRLDLMRKYQPPKQYHIEPRPGKTFIPFDERSKEDGTQP
ncbi:MAG: methylenetetrahydrofolate reductase C-terminal domain-containing protein [Deltaproteobacteria bacterium]|nr:methylenetetrahydrofolate reductase C-terminal domain-containing protein [Deltaproteobacteria bacterium]